MQLYSVHAGNFKLDGGAMFGVVPKSIWNKLIPADDNNLCTLAMRSLLIQDADKLILIDTGLGNKQSDKFFSHYHIHGPTLAQSLHELGFSGNDITDVVFTHLHFDHCGGAFATQNNTVVPAFPNARYWSNPIHWQWATQPNPREKASFLTDNILPIQQSGRLHFVEAANDGQLHPSGILPQLQYKFSYGHTQAMMIPYIEYKGHTIVFMADLLPTVAHIPLPYVMSYDMFPMQTLQEKAAFFEEAITNQYILFLQHDATNECCTLHHTDKGVRAHRIFNLNEL